MNASPTLEKMLSPTLKKLFIASFLVYYAGMLYSTLIYFTPNSFAFNQEWMNISYMFLSPLVMALVAHLMHANRALSLDNLFSTAVVTSAAFLVMNGLQQAVSSTGFRLAFGDSYTAPTDAQMKLVEFIGNYGFPLIFVATLAAVVALLSVARRRGSW